MNVMVVGGGAREHAISAELAPEVDRLFVAPGNVGTGSIAENVPIPATDIPALRDFVVQNDVDLTVVTPDDTLALGLVDELNSVGRAAFGPTQKAARIESAKDYAKDLMFRKGILTADYQVFTDPDEALEHLSKQTFPHMVKASGLALGKGALVCWNFDDARQAINDAMVAKKFKSAGDVVVTETYIGDEYDEESLHAVCDGKTYEMFPSSKDHKTIFDNNRGPMTGGMGAIAPVPGLDLADMDARGKLVVAPALEGLREDGAEYKGILYPGLKGPYVLEYNSRFGDPETQVYMRLLKSSLLRTMVACVDGRLAEAKPEWSDKTAICVVLASLGYPESSTKDTPLEGIEDAEKVPDVKIYHAGTAIKDGQLVTNAGRVLSVTYEADNLESARKGVYDVIDRYINVENLQLRRDIGLSAL